MCVCVCEMFEQLRFLCCMKWVEMPSEQRKAVNSAPGYRESETFLCCCYGK